MPMCLCPSCKQVINSAARTCEHCEEDFGTMSTGRGRTIVIMLALIGMPICLSLYARGLDSPIKRIMVQQAAMTKLKSAQATLKIDSFSENRSGQKQMLFVLPRAEPVSRR